MGKKSFGGFIASLDRPGNFNDMVWPLHQIGFKVQRTSCGPDLIPINLDGYLLLKLNFSQLVLLLLTDHSRKNTGVTNIIDGSVLFKCPSKP